MGTSYPESIDDFTNPTEDSTMDGEVGGIELYHDTQHADLNDAVEALETTVGVTGDWNFLPSAGNGGLLLDDNFVFNVPNEANVPAIKIQFVNGRSIGNNAIQIFDGGDSPIWGVGNTGGSQVWGDRNQAAPGVFGPWLSLDATVNPPALLFPGSTYAGSAHIYGWGGTPAAGWVSGTTHVNDLWYNFTTGTWYQCTVSGAGTSAGTWVTAFGIGAQVEYNSVTSPYSCLCAAGNTWYLANTTSGTTPGITLPNDGNIYRVEFIPGQYIANSTPSTLTYWAVGTGAATTDMLAFGEAPCTAQGAPTPIVAPHVTGSGQVLKIYTQSALATTVNFQAGANAPSSLAAYRVG